MTLELADEAVRAGLPISAHHHTESHGEIVVWLKEHAPEDAWILVKGSRGMTMERVVEGILSQ